MEILSLGEKIKRRRKELGMTLKELAGDRITPGQISLVESGKSNPSMDLLEYLAEALDTTVEYLMESEESQAEKVCVFYENIAESHILAEEYALGEEYIEKSLYYAEKYNLEYRKAKDLYLKGLICMSKKENTDAQQYFLSSNVIFVKNNSYEDVVNTFLNLGKIACETNSYHSACSYFQQAENVYLANNLVDDFKIGEIYYHLSYVFYKLGNLEKSIKYSYLAKEKFHHIENKEEYAKTLMLLAEEYKTNGDFDNAIKYSKMTLKIFEEINEQTYMAVIENNLGKLFYEFNDLDESFVHLNRAKELRLQNKDERIVDTLIDICENYIKLKNLGKAEEILAEILDEAQEENILALKEYYLLRYKIELLKNDDKAAEKMLLMALEHVENMGLDRDKAEISIMLGKFYMDRNMEKEAANYLNSGVDSFRKIGIIK